MVIVYSQEVSVLIIKLLVCEFFVFFYNYAKRLISTGIKYSTANEIALKSAFLICTQTPL